MMDFSRKVISRSVQLLHKCKSVDLQFFLRTPAALSWESKKLISKKI